MKIPKHGSEVEPSRKQSCSVLLAQAAASVSIEPAGTPYDLWHLGSGGRTIAVSPRSGLGFELVEQKPVSNCLKTKSLLSYYSV